ncbi:MAG: hypothetical protein ACOCP8_10010 [archaeon]
MNCVAYESTGWERGLFGSNITYSDLKKYAKIIAEKDIRLAHRIYTGKENHMKNLLRDYYDEYIHKIETRRMEFKQFIKNRNDMEFHEAGYKIYSMSYNDTFVKGAIITFDIIDNLSDEILLESIEKDNFEDILNSIRNQAIEAKITMDKLEKAK